MNIFESKYITTDFNPEQREKSELSVLELCKKVRNREIDVSTFWSEINKYIYHINYIDSDHIYSEEDYYCYVIDVNDQETEDIRYNKMIELGVIDSIEELINEKR